MNQRSSGPSFAERSRLAHHVRWHAKKGVSEEGCSYCVAEEGGNSPQAASARG